MFVFELDRPWLETPFLLQGFLIENADQIEQLRKFCRFVYIDRSRSVGDQFASAPTEAPDKPVPESAPRAPAQGYAGGAPNYEGGFFDLLRQMRVERAARSGRVAPDDSDGVDNIHRDWMETLPDTASDVADGGATDASVPSRLDPRAWIEGLVDRWRHRKNEREVPPAPEDAPARTGPQPVYPDTVSVEREMRVAERAFDVGQNAVADLLTDLRANRAPDVDRVQHAVEDLAHSVVRNPDALLWLTRLKRNDRYSYDHALDVAIHVMVFGRHLGLPRDQLKLLGVAGMLQDVGKLRCPVELLQKNGSLSNEEFGLIKQHVTHTLAMLEKDGRVPGPVLEVIRRHHERVDGSGYPHGLKGEGVGLFGEMAGIVDGYCAMTSHRAYGVAVENQRALEQIYARRGKQFSENTVDQFIQCIGLYPVGTLVELNTGEVAVVVEQNRVRRLKPRVMVLLGPDKSPNRFPPMLDLITDPLAFGDTSYRIVRALPVGSHGIDPREFYL
ncbi:MAG: HD-GYP domain-containing protein [Rhodocyclaceae bacterium]|nr:HD-GYP domain-containing protein [Rhodocyclaceae bacterium]MBX3669769.1 HD-GYP domain-containing protein [Rhodocyclaceae bacterium]